MARDKDLARQYLAEYILLFGVEQMGVIPSTPAEAAWIRKMTAESGLTFSSLAAAYFKEGKEEH